MKSKSLPLSPMEDAIRREQEARAREAGRGTPAVLNDLASHIRRPRTHKICMNCRQVVWMPTVFRDGHWQPAMPPEFAARVCQCDNPSVVETVW